MAATLYGENFLRDIEFMDVSDTDDTLICFGVHNRFKLEFYRVIGGNSIAAESEYVTPTDLHKGILNIELSAYFAYFNNLANGYWFIHEKSMESIFVEFLPGDVYKRAVMVLGTQYLLTSSINGTTESLQGFLLADLISCHSTCKSCAGLTTETGCTACSSPKFLNEGKCGLECPAGKFKNYGLNTCDLCDPSCATCTSGDFNGCTTCILSRVYNGDG